MQVFAFVHFFVIRLSKLPLNSLNMFHSLVLQRHHLLPREKTHVVTNNGLKCNTAIGGGEGAGLH